MKQPDGGLVVATVACKVVNVNVNVYFAGFTRQTEKMFTSRPQTADVSAFGVFGSSFRRMC